MTETRPNESRRLARFRSPSPGISVVVPLFNEAPNLEPLAAEIREALDRTESGYEVLLVDDGSTDSSARVLHALATRDSRVRPIFLRKHAGQSAALCAGFAAARGAVVVTLDGDLQNDPADIPMLLDRLDGADVISGIRATRQDSWHRRVSSVIANGVRRGVLGDSIRDIGCSLKVYRASFLRDIPEFDGMHRFLPALAQLAGARVVQAPVRHRPRRHGRSKYGVNNRLWRALADLWAVRWMARRGFHRAAAAADRGAGRR